MNRINARRIANIITNEQLANMFAEAKDSINDWTKVSSVNKGMTKGLSWNILASKFDIQSQYHIIAKTNMIREFGEFLPDTLTQQTAEKKKADSKPPRHQDPIF